VITSADRPTLRPGRAEQTGPPGGPGADTPLRERGVATQTREKVARPPKFKVILFNDDYTPMEFVVAVLEQVFRKSPAEATQLMLTIHRSGLGVAGVYVLELAETKVVAVHRMAEERGFPLRAGVEKE
jgi:ATP-dependent Clp protease adaptor protein ClpS